MPETRRMERFLQSKKEECTKKPCKQERIKDMITGQHFKRIGMTAIVMAIAISMLAQNRINRNGKQGWSGSGVRLRLTTTIPAQPLSVAEAKGLSFLREEEKLAHDVYTRFYLRYSLPIFQNIAQAEQRHFSALKVLLDRYGVPDPTLGQGAGEFTDAGLKTLYAELINQGESSLQAALSVGATIEELDIRDLREALKMTDNNDLQMIYKNLQQGSENHLRTFIGRLQTIGQTYRAQYIDAAALTEILGVQNSNNAGRGFRGNGEMRMGRGNAECLRRAQ